MKDCHACGADLLPDGRCSDEDCPSQRPTVPYPEPSHDIEILNVDEIEIDVADILCPVCGTEFELNASACAECGERRPPPGMTSQPCRAPGTEGKSSHPPAFSRRFYRDAKPGDTSYSYVSGRPPKRDDVPTVIPPPPRPKRRPKT